MRTTIREENISLFYFKLVEMLSVFDRMVLAIVTVKLFDLVRNSEWASGNVS